jgi:hypothetical protein
VYEKSLEIRHFRVLPYSKEAELDSFRAAGVARGRKPGKAALTEAVRFTLEGGQDAKMEIFAKIEVPSRQRGGQGGHRAKVGGAAVLEAAGSRAAKCRRLVCGIARGFP